MKLKRNFKRIKIFTFCIIFMPLLAFTQSIKPKVFEYPYQVDVYDLPKASNGIGYRLYVRHPLVKPQEGEKSAVFYFLDPLTLFVPAAAMTYNYEYFNYIPSAYYVGIGYQNEADGKVKEANRTRDYTPTAFTPPDSTHYLAANPVDYINSGGTDAFIEVILNQIFPFMEDNFEVSKTERVLIGKSMSGLAATHVLLSRPSLFSKYLIVSPAIWWDDWLYERKDRYVMKQTAKVGEGDFMKETKAYFAVGAVEERLGLVTDLYVLQNFLRMKRIPHLKLYLDVLEGEQHEGVFPCAFMKGIVGLYVGEEKRRESASLVAWD